MHVAAHAAVAAAAHDDDDYDYDNDDLCLGDDNDVDTVDSLVHGTAQKKV